ncbi:hypothetical protein JJD84_29040 [Pseudomonas fluorescens]|nr:hypothetical protein [Pseudomonas fluorescens]
MLKTITQVTPCSGWYYLAAHPTGEPLIYHVAAWGLLDNGEVVGLVPVGPAPNGNAPKYPRLVPVPETSGIYVPEVKLSPEQRVLAGITN